MVRVRALGKTSYNIEPLVYVYVCPLARNMVSNHK